MKSQAIKAICDAIHVGTQVATILLTLAGGDVDLVIRASKAANGLDQCKANIINERFANLEEWEEEE